MPVSYDISSFKQYSLPEKFAFFYNGDTQKLHEFSEKELHGFLKTIITDETENSDIRKRALEIFVNFVLVDKIKLRHAVSLLLDDLEDTKEIFLQLRRLKDMFLFYEEEEQEIRAIYEGLKEHQHSEISSECCYQLGLIYFYEANKSSDSLDAVLDHIDKSQSYFHQSQVIIENRIDAKFFSELTKLLFYILQKKYSTISKSVENLGQLLWEKNIFSFRGEVSSLQVGLYRTIFSLKESIKESPEEWLDFRESFDTLCCYFYEIKNAEIIERLAEDQLLKTFSERIIADVVEPYFQINFHAQVKRIEKRASEIDSNSEGYKFLIYLKGLIEENRSKKKRQRMSYSIA
ncbi:MAG: hypothetical protein D3922_11930 [Candidatus Electrothrix sp. AR1]|nr:hypothetical protein [Candidatus Electrothrix sp. AR1]